MSTESMTEADISAALDDIELDALVSLLDEESVFQGLQQLPLFAPSSSSVQPCEAQETADMGAEFDDLFQDALEFVGLPTQSVSEPLTMATGGEEEAEFVPDLSAPSGPPNTEDVSLSLFQQLPVETLQALGVCSSQLPANLPLVLGNPTSTDAESETVRFDIAATTINSSSSSRLAPVLDPNTGICLSNMEPTTVDGSLEAQMAAVNHDHCYTALSERELSSSSMQSISHASAVSQGSEVDEGNSSDGGYDTMSSLTTSPASTKTGEPGQVAMATTGPFPFQQLPDPVKLIDERIKFFMNTQQVQLSEEEKETLRAEGLPIPTTLPLTKVEERALKTVRRKIRNKIAAQDSRKKKKEYVQALEERVQQCTDENHKLQRKVETLEMENKTLLQQLRQVQLLLARTNPVLGRPIQLGSCLMVVVLCFGILFGNLLPYRVSLSSSSDYTTSTVRSRALLSVDNAPGIMNWQELYKSLLPGRTEHTHQHTPTHAETNELTGNCWSRSTSLFGTGTHCDRDNDTASSPAHPPLITAKA